MFYHNITNNNNSLSVCAIDMFFSAEINKTKIKNNFYTYSTEILSTNAQWTKSSYGKFDNAIELSSLKKKQI